MSEQVSDPQARAHAHMKAGEDGAVKQWRGTIAELENKLADVTAERDELLAALKAVILEADRGTDAFISARALIASIEERKP